MRVDWGQAELVANHGCIMRTPNGAHRQKLAPTGIKQLHLWRRRPMEEAPISYIRHH